MDSCKNQARIAVAMYIDNNVMADQKWYAWIIRPKFMLFRRKYFRFRKEAISNLEYLAVKDGDALMLKHLRESYGYDGRDSESFN